MPDIQLLRTSDENFWQQLDRVLAWDDATDKQIEATVVEILADVRKRGDDALLEYTNRYDHVSVSKASELEVPAAELDRALQQVPDEQISALQQAADRIRKYARHQKLESWSFTEEDGTRLGQKVSAIERVGLYVPGGKASYPSSVLMNAIPANVAGVDQIVMVVPTPNGDINDLVLAAARIAGVNRVFTIGGAQAIAALAYGTDSVPAVDKIVGPGNAYVATAKRMVFGTVGIDMIAGPSEILVVCDGNTDADWIAMDLFSQAEHDEQAQAILLSPDEAFIQKVRDSIDRLLPQMSRKDIITASLGSRGAMIHVADLDEAAKVANYISPEHLELSVADADALADKIKNAGAIFLGPYTAEALGDYCAGPNHVLPTSRTARFSSPLGVYDFQKRSSLIQCSEQGASDLGMTASILAKGEGLDAHARSAEYRISKK